jgi:hypothetical protein
MVGNGHPSFQARFRMTDIEHFNAAAARRAEAPLATSVLSRSSSSALQGALIRLMIRFAKAYQLELTGYGSVPLWAARER